MVSDAPERGKPRGVVTRLTPAELSVHMRGVAAQRAAYSAIGKAVVEIVERSRAEQGLPSRVDDPATLSRISDLVSSGGAT
jgi:hypothetical protein